LLIDLNVLLGLLIDLSVMPDARKFNPKSFVSAECGM
jgi:hypothetical protein